MNPVDSIFAPRTILMPITTPVDNPFDPKRKQRAAEATALNAFGIPEIPIPKRCRGELRSETITIQPSEQVDISIAPSFSFWPDQWRLEGEGANGLFLRGLAIGSEFLYPNRYQMKPRYISRAAAEAFDREQKRHFHEGITVEEASRHSLVDRFLYEHLSARWTFENRGETPIAFVLVMEGQEVA